MQKCIAQQKNFCSNEDTNIVIAINDARNISEGEVFQLTCECDLSYSKGGGIVWQLKSERSEQQRKRQLAKRKPQAARRKPPPVAAKNVRKG